MNIFHSVRDTAFTGLLLVLQKSALKKSWPVLASQLAFRSASLGWKREHPCHTLNVIIKNFWTRVCWGDRSVATGVGDRSRVTLGCEKGAPVPSSGPKVGPVCLQGQVPSSTGSS